MTGPRRGPVGEALWLEPGLAALLFAVAVVLNSGEPWRPILVIDLVCCAGAALSYRFPVIGPAVVTAGMAAWLFVPAVLASVSGMAYLIAVMAATRRNVAWKYPLVLGFAALGYTILIWRDGPSSQYLGGGIILLTLTVVAVGAGELWRRWQRLLELEREQAEADLQAFRLELARDLHDTVAHTLSATAMRANLALTEAPSGPLRDDLEWMATECRSSAHDLRQLLGRLRAGESSPVGPELASVDTLRATVESQAERLRAAGFTVNCQVGIERLSAARAQALSAVCVEAVNNIVRHATPATPCDLTLAENGPEVVATYRNVTGSPAGRRAGMGLTGVRERLALLGGTCEVRHVGSQWELAARLPHGVEWEG